MERSVLAWAGFATESVLRHGQVPGQKIAAGPVVEAIFWDGVAKNSPATESGPVIYISPGFYFNEILSLWRRADVAPVNSANRPGRVRCQSSSAIGTGSTLTAAHHEASSP